MRHFFKYYFLKIILILVGLEIIYFAWLQYRNQRPVANDDTISVYQRHSVKHDVVRNDEDKDVDDTLKLANVNKPGYGTIEIVNERTIQYVPDNNYIGIDSFQYIINDGKKDSKPAYIKVNILENKAPIANNDEFVIFPWSVLSLNLLNNDRDNEGDSIYLDLYTDPLFGQITSKESDLKYTLSSMNNELDSFNYTISDGVKISDKATVRIKIKHVKSSIFSNIPYYGDLKNYMQFNPSLWDIETKDGIACIAINTSSYNGLSGNRTGAYNIIKNRWFNGDFKIKLKIKNTDDLENNSAADQAVYFAFIDYENYCYASFSSHSSGDGYTGIFKIVNGQREQVVCEGQAFTDNDFHDYDIIRKGNEVTIKVDGKELCKGEDEVFALKGRIGIGSFNDMACFDDVRIDGKFQVIPE